ncbi:hypothetical protein HDU96_010949, partial [Phlyctochytrium bullatum]
EEDVRSILLRACQLAKVGARIVYSTCTFNPVENEAVVAAALNECNGALTLEDVSKELPELIRRPGLSSWKVMDGDGTFHDTYKDIPEKFQKKLANTLFPPDNAGELGLDKCLRINPADQNTGGFFVAVLSKVGEYGQLDKRVATTDPTSAVAATVTQQNSNGEIESEADENLELLSSEGIQLMSQFLSAKRVMEVGLEDFLLLLEGEYPKLGEFSESLRQHFESMEVGCVVGRFTPSTESKAAGSVIEASYFPIWRAEVSASLLIPKKERMGLIARLTGKIYDTHRSKRKGDKEESTPSALTEGHVEEELSADMVDESNEHL